MFKLCLFNVSERLSLVCEHSAAIIFKLRCGNKAWEMYRFLLPYVTYHIHFFKKHISVIKTYVIVHFCKCELLLAKSHALISWVESNRGWHLLPKEREKGVEGEAVIKRKILPCIYTLTKLNNVMVVFHKSGSESTLLRKLQLYLGTYPSYRYGDFIIENDKWPWRFSWPWCVYIIHLFIQWIFIEDLQHSGNCDRCWGN